MTTYVTLRVASPVKRRSDGLGPLPKGPRSILPGLGACSHDRGPPASRLPHKLPAWNWPRPPPVSIFANFRSILTPWLNGGTQGRVLSFALLSIKRSEIWQISCCPSRRRGALKTQGVVPTPAVGSGGPGSGPWGSPTRHQPTPWPCFLLWAHSLHLCYCLFNILLQWSHVFAQIHSFKMETLHHLPQAEGMTQEDGSEVLLPGQGAELS